MKAEPGKAIIQRDDAALRISFTAEAEKLKQEALETAGLIGRVTNAAENERGVAAQTALNDLCKTVEKARKEVKEPVITFGRAIDEAAREFTDELRNELSRVSGLLGDFASLESARIRAADAARRLEEEKLETERKVEIQRTIDAQRIEQEKLDQQAQEAAERLNAAKTAKAKEKAQADQIEIDRQKQLSLATSHGALDAINEHHAKQMADLPSVVAPVRATGQVVKDDWKIEVIGDGWLLAVSHRSCVKIEPRLTEIKELLRLGTEVKGIVATPITVAGVRAGKQQRALDV